MTVTLQITENPDPTDVALLGERLAVYNDADVGASGRRTLAVFVRDEAGAILGGISGYTAWGWLYIQWLWLAETHRGQGLAGSMLEAAEAEGRTRGCHGAYIDTFNPVALKVYQRQGYVAFGALEDFPPGRTRTFLHKPL